ncbi:MAG: metallophosphoesterase [Treponema sp.]|nr:metallophosphoesterase [Treponema sp.]
MNSKKILVFSDSHGSVKTLKSVFNWANDHIPPNGTICAAVCCGDGLFDLQRASEETGFFSDWKFVRGNNDYGIQAPEAAVFEINEHCFFLCHGHRYGIYESHHRLLAAAKSNNADAVFFGHTHVPFIKNADGILLINPGSVGQPRSRIGATFAVIECTEDKPLKAEFWGISPQGSINKVKI